MTLGRLWCLSKPVGLSDTQLMLNVGHCISVAALCLQELGCSQKGLEIHAGLGAGGSCCSGREEVAAAAEQREAPPFSRIVRQSVYRAET